MTNVVFICTIIFYIVISEDNIPKPQVTILNLSNLKQLVIIFFTHELVKSNQFKLYCNM